MYSTGHIHLQLDTRSRCNRQLAISWIHISFTRISWHLFRENCKKNERICFFSFFYLLTRKTPPNARMTFSLLLILLSSNIASSMPSSEYDQQCFQWFVLNIVNPNNGILFAFSVGCCCFCISPLFKFNWANLHNEIFWDSFSW